MGKILGNRVGMGKIHGVDSRRTAHQETIITIEATTLQYLNEIIITKSFSADSGTLYG